MPIRMNGKMDSLEWLISNNVYGSLMSACEHDYWDSGNRIGPASAAAMIFEDEATSRNCFTLKRERSIDEPLRKTMATN
jgi:hypothetical protein